MFIRVSVLFVQYISLEILLLLLDMCVLFVLAIVIALLFLRVLLLTAFIFKSCASVSDSLMI